MVKKTLIFFGLSIAFILIFAFFLPKKNLLYFIQKELYPSHIVFDFKQVSESGYSLKLQESILYFEGVDVFTCKRSEIRTYLLYNTIFLKNIVLSDLAKEFIPLKVDNLKIIYGIHSPLQLSFNGNGDFGTVKGYVDLVQKKLFLILYPSVKMKKKYYKTLRYLHKNKQGELSYEYNY